mgnify:CR=1 FL=1
MASLNSNKFTISFSKQNQDIKDDLIKKKENNINISNYICDAIRFYESNKNNNYTQSNIDIEKIIETKLSEMLKDKIIFNDNEKLDESTNLEDLAKTNQFINFEDD